MAIRNLHRTSAWMGSALLMGVLFGSLLSCASYSDRVREAQLAVSRGEPERALRVINEELDVESAEEIPANLGGDRSLLLLERATLLQAAGDYENAARDMIAVDDQMEWVDLRGGGSTAVMRFLFTDDAGHYRAPPHERLLLHTINLINFMAAGDLSGARVEARRFDILQNYFLDNEFRAVLPVLLGLGNYLAGAAYEASREYEEAARFYTLAYLYGTWPEAGDDRLIDILALSGYQGSGLGDMRGRAEDLLSRAADRTPMDRRTYQATYQTGDTLVVVQTGLVPYRQAKRMAMGTALQYSSTSPYAEVHLDSRRRQQAVVFHRQGLVSWLNVPVLTKRGLPARRTASLEVAGQNLRLTGAISISDQIEAGWNLVSATAVAAAISRAVVRAAAGETTRAVTDSVAQNRGSSPAAAGLLSWLLATAVEGSMAAADTPDTRSWTSLPADIHLIRLRLPEGPQQIRLRVNNRLDERQVQIDHQRFQLFNFSRLR